MHHLLGRSWGRVAALLCRATQALLTPCTARLQCCVDDPLVAARGPEDDVVRAVSAVVLCWRACGVDLAWNSGSTAGEAMWRFAVAHVGIG